MNPSKIKKERMAFWISFGRHVWVRFQEDRCTFIASSLTLTTLLSLVPLMAVALAIFSAFPDFTQLIAEIQDFLFQNFVPTAGEVVQKYIQDFVSQAQRLKAVGIVFLIITALLMMATIDNALNTIWRVKVKRQWVRIFLLYWAILTLGPILVGFSVGLTSYFVSLPVISDAAEQVGSLIATVLPFFLTSIALTMAYVSIPNCKVKIGHALFGGIIAALLFELAKRGFALYITTVPTYKLVFGTFATIPIFLVWVYLSWLVVLFGAEIVHGFADHHPDRNEISRENRFSIAMQIISLCYRCQKKGIPVSKEVLTKEFVHLSEDEIGGVVSSLLEIQILGELSSGAYVLQWDLKELTLSHLYHLLKWPLPDGNDLSLPPAVSNTLNEADKALGKSLAVSLYELFEISK